MCQSIKTEVFKCLSILMFLLFTWGISLSLLLLLCFCVIFFRPWLHPMMYSTLHTTHLSTTKKKFYFYFIFFPNLPIYSKQSKHDKHIFVWFFKKKKIKTKNKKKVKLHAVLRKSFLLWHGMAFLWLYYLLSLTYFLTSLQGHLN